MKDGRKMICTYFGEERLKEIEDYIEKVQKEEFMELKEETVAYYFQEYSQELLKRMNYEDTVRIKSYTGLGFKKINPILKGYWDYEFGGKLTEKMKNEAYKESEELRKSLLKDITLPFNIKVYRGVNLSNFYRYGINSLEYLSLLKGQYLYESGFTSTSLIRDKSFFCQKPDWGYDCNIEMCIYIPVSEDGIYLGNLSTSPSQYEFLINNSSLYKVIEVQIDKEAKKGSITMILIPERVWNIEDYEREHLSFYQDKKIK